MLKQSNSPRSLPARKTKPAAATVRYCFDHLLGFECDTEEIDLIFLSLSQSGPRCMARFDFEGEHSDELSFSEGDVIQLKAYVGQDWARGQMGSFMGIFPLNFVEVIEDLPPPSSEQPDTTPGAVKPAQVTDVYVNGERGGFCHSSCRTGSRLCPTGSCITSVHSVGFSGWCGVGGGSLRLCRKFRRRPVLSAGRSHSDQPAY